MCGYVCTGCGRCRGENSRTKAFGVCLVCGAQNSLEACVCTECGAALVLPPGAVLEPSDVTEVSSENKRGAA